MVRLLCILGLALAFAVPAAALPPRGSAPPVQPMAITGVLEVNQVVRPSAPVAAGAACQWLRSGAAISGATSCTGYTVQAADVAAGANALKLQVQTPGKTAFAALSVSQSCPTSGTTGAAYSCTATASGGPGSGYAYALAGAWPAPLSLAGNVVSGTLPATPGVYPGLSFTATDPLGGSAASSAFTLTVTAPAGGGGGAGSFDFSVPGNATALLILF